VKSWQSRIAVSAIVRRFASALGEGDNPHSRSMKATRLT